ncbi:MAG: hypothetical protein ABIT01_18005 [Thermoanaerobaculia bacterium]
MQKMRRIPALLAVLALGVLGLPSCSTNTQGDDASPVFLAASFDLLPLSTNVNSGAALQISTVTVRNILKIPGANPNQFLDVRLEGYTVTWTRLDGGRSLPPAEQWGGNVIVPVNGQSTLSNYPFLSSGALLRPPFDQLFPFNGGIDRDTNQATIRLRGEVVFFGRTLSGQTATGKGNFDMIFFYGSNAAQLAVPKNDGVFGARRLPSFVRNNLFLSGFAAIALR